MDNLDLRHKSKSELYLVHNIPLLAEGMILGQNRVSFDSSSKGSTQIPAHNAYTSAPISLSEKIKNWQTCLRLYYSRHPPTNASAPFRLRRQNSLQQKLFALLYKCHRHCRTSNRRLPTSRHS